MTVLVCNDMEHERLSVDIRVGERGTSSCFHSHLIFQVTTSSSTRNIPYAFHAGSEDRQTVGRHDLL